MALSEEFISALETGRMGPGMLQKHYLHEYAWELQSFEVSQPLCVSVDSV